MSLICQFEHARFLRIDNHEPEQIITLGHERWMVFPFYRKDISVRDGTEGSGRAFDHTGTFGWAIRYGVDIILTAHAYCFVEKRARDKARFGAVGYHPSLLPKYKGKHAVKLAFDNGDKIVGGSLYQLDDGWDTGQVLAQKSVTVDDGDTMTSLWQDKLAPIGVALFRGYLIELIDNL